MNAELKEELEYRGRTEMPKILLAAAECAPLAKTGGLADVVGTLPKALAKLGADARIIVPYHRIIKEKYGSQVTHMVDFYSHLGWRSEYVGLERLELDGVIIYMIDSEKYFGDKIYRDGNAEGEQYSYFCRAVLDAIPCLDFVPDIVHCNDWHTAMIPMLARTQYPGGIQSGLKFLLTIHNIAFQGKYSFDYVRDLLGVDGRYYTPEFMELNGCADYMKAGCVFTDRINTVSPTYAAEIKTPYYAEGLEGILNARSNQLSGIINGIDNVVFNPEADEIIPAAYSLADLSGKGECKEELQRKMGLHVNPNVPIVAMVTRMTEQKGFDLVCSILDDVLQNTDMQFMLLGSGDSRFEDAMRNAEQRWKGRVAAYIGYNDSLAHLVYAGSDFYLMPSRFEPCGLSQMIAMRYGTIPIVRETGGLKDTVEPYNKFTGEGTGFSFANYSARELRDTLMNALSCYGNEEIMNGLISRAMKMDFGFDVSAVEYARLYISIMGSNHSVPLVLYHASDDISFRNPAGSVECGSSVTLSLRKKSGSIINPTLVTHCNGVREEYSLTQRDNEYYAAIKVPDEPSLLRYCFRVETADGMRWVGPDHSGFRSRILDYEAEGFLISVYQSGFRTPEWFREGIIYHVFPDSFEKSSPAIVKRGMEYHTDLGQKVSLNKSDSCNQSPDSFYGGTLNGITRKLDYLKELGITCIYLTSVFESPSNHRGDVSDYRKIDPILGSEKDFANLCRKAEKLGIRIIMDGIFNHTGSDSIYFNAEGHYSSSGAAQGEASPYRDWFSFGNDGDYRCWWNMKEYPEVNETLSDWQQYIASSQDSVVRQWMRQGASGWRVSVADEIPDSALEVLRTAVKDENPEAVLIGEVWDDAVTKVSYGVHRKYALGTSLDSVMNYPLREAIIDFVTGKNDAFCFRDFLLKQKLNYPEPIYYALMNLLGSHDVERILSRLNSDSSGWSEAIRLEKLCAGILFAVPGVPSVYYGDEQEMTGDGVPMNRGKFRITENNSLFRWYQELCGRRSKSAALKNGKSEFIAYSSDILLILRYTDAEAVLCAVNRGAENASFSFSADCCSIQNVGVTVPARSCTFIDLK